MMNMLGKFFSNRDRIDCPGLRSQTLKITGINLLRFIFLTILKNKFNNALTYMINKDDIMDIMQEHERYLLRLSPQAHHYKSISFVQAFPEHLTETVCI